MICLGLIRFICHKNANLNDFDDNPEGESVTTDEYPRLCGGIFMTLSIQALRQRMKAREHYKGESDGLTNPETLVGLIKVINPDYQDIGKDKFKGTANNYKACKISKKRISSF